MRERLVLSVLALACLACQAFEPTIEERQRDLDGPAPAPAPVSIQEDFPALLAGPVEAPEPEPVEAPAEAAYVPPRIGDDQVLGVEFREASLSQVVHFIAEQAGINIVLDPYLDRQVDVSFPNVTLDSALQAVLSQHGLQLVESTPGIYSIELHDGSQAAVASFEVQSINVLDVQANLEQLVSSGGQVLVDGPQNLVVVHGSQADVDAVSNYLLVADHLKRQVLIEVRILEVSLTDDFQLGVTSALNDGTINGDLVNIFQGLAVPDQSFEVMFQSESGKVDVAIQAIRAMTGVDLVSSPRILAMTGTEAKIEVLREVPYINVTNTTISDPTTGAGTNVIEEVQFKEAGVTLTVTPTVMGSGAIQLRVFTEYSEVVAVFNSIPVIDERVLSADFLVRDRHTVVMGGLMQDKRMELDKGVPGLMNLPLLGRLFRKDEDRTEKRELLVFLTPRIVDDDEAGRLTDTFRGVYTQRLRENGVHPLSER